MDVTDLVDAVRSEANTELSRLGSSKSLYADTQGEMEPGAVLAAMADSAHYAAETADGWANEDDGYADVYRSVADTAREQYDAIVSDLDGHDPGDRPAAPEVLRGFDRPLARLGGLVGWTLVADEKASQATGFFTGQADPNTAGLFRDFRGDYEDLQGEVLDALEAAAVEGDAGDAVPGSGEDVEFTADPEDSEDYVNTSAMEEDEAAERRDEVAGDDGLTAAQSAAVQVVGAAYDEYVERLEAQGVNPKPVC